MPIKFADFLTDTQQIGNGIIVNEPDWQVRLENSTRYYFSSFVQKTRFSSAYPTTMTPASFVDTLFAFAGVIPSAADRQAAINEFATPASTPDLGARARVLRRVAENSILYQQEFNKAFVLMLYFGYLQRNPNDAPEPTLDFKATTSG